MPQKREKVIAASYEEREGVPLPGPKGRIARNCVVPRKRATPCPFLK